MAGYNNRKNKKQKISAKGKKRIFLFSMLLSLITILIIFFSVPNKKQSTDRKIKTGGITTSRLKELIRNKSEKDITKKYFTINSGEEIVVAETSINEKLQSYLQSEINTALNRGDGAPEILSIVVMDPDSGAILGMSGHSSDTDQNRFPCSRALYPAASLFKIIASAAVIEEKGYYPNQKLWFNGGKYTLYKRQLKLKKNKYTNYIKFKDAFAQSVNPVFGKLGIFELKEKLINEYSDRFLFNTEVCLDIPSKPSVVNDTETKYSWAETACGFNNNTKISTLHAAMINACIASDGMLSPPFLVKKIRSDQKKIIYRHTKKDRIRIITEDTARALSVMMKRTVTNGTAKSAFKLYRRKKAMQDLIIGGKTGSIYNITHTIKYDWFTGFAKRKTDEKSIAFAILVGHGHFIGRRAAEYGRRLISNYFAYLYKQK